MAIQRQAQHGGARPVFPRHVDNGLLDLRALRHEIEEAEAMAECTSGVLRRQWTQYRDTLETALDVRLNILARDVRSHEQAISGQRTALCGRYDCTDPSCAELICLARTRQPQTKTAAGMAAAVG